MLISGTFLKFPPHAFNVWGYLDVLFQSLPVYCQEKRRRAERQTIWPQKCQPSSGPQASDDSYLFLYVPSTPLKSLVSLIIHALSYFHFLHNYRTVPNTTVSLIYLSTTVRRPHPKKAVDIIMRFILSSLLTETFLLLLNINYPWPAVPFC